ncbi:MAG TPA: phosphoribosyltransferase family protein, partial [Flavobacteriales bacterium]|nr:phosphoribosyltransferase family protein [Flavobacteriales bacterium]
MTTVQLHDLRFEPFISEQELGRAIDVVAVGINAKYAGMRPLFIGVLNGSFFFASELLKRITIECEITFVKVASYHGTTSTGQVHQLIGLNERIHGRHVVVLEDIVDTGNTIEHLMGVLADHQPASVSVAALLFKPAAYTKDLP